MADKSTTGIVYFLVFLLIIAGVFWYMDHSQLSQRVLVLEQMPAFPGSELTVEDIQGVILQQQDAEIASYIQNLAQKSVEISVLQRRVTELESSLNSAESELFKTRAIYDEMLSVCNLQEPIEVVINYPQAYKLLWDIRETVKPAILDHLGFVKPVEPANDDERWERADKIYEWMSKNFEFCRDPAASDFTKFTFTSPDELLSEEDEDVVCGDVDDYAMLYAGAMYASGVSEHDLIVACGDTHCWNLILKRDRPYEGWYVIDSACTQPYELSRYYGLSFSKPGFPGFWQRVICFNNYDAEITFGPNFYQEN